MHVFVYVYVWEFRIDALIARILQMGHESIWRTQGCSLPANKGRAAAAEEWVIIGQIEKFPSGGMEGTTFYTNKIYHARVSCATSTKV